MAETGLDQEWSEHLPVSNLNPCLIMSSLSQTSESSLKACHMIFCKQDRPEKGSKFRESKT